MRELLVRLGLVGERRPLPTWRRWVFAVVALLEVVVGAGALNRGDRTGVLYLVVAALAVTALVSDARFRRRIGRAPVRAWTDAP